MLERIAKQKINVILVVDTSKSMQGKRIEQVNSSIKEIKDYLIDLEDENQEKVDLSKVESGTKIIVNDDDDDDDLEKMELM